MDGLSLEKLIFLDLRKGRNRYGKLSTMNNYSQNLATVLRILLGWFMFFAGIEKVLDPAWTAKGFLLSAKTFPVFYAWFAEPYNIWWIDPINAWSITLVGLFFLLGIYVRPAAWGGALLMIMYYFPHYVFPAVPHGYIVEEHFIYAAAFLLVAYLPLDPRFSLQKYLSLKKLESK